MKISKFSDKKTQISFSKQTFDKSNNQSFISGDFENQDLNDSIFSASYFAGEKKFIEQKEIIQNPSLQINSEDMLKISQPNIDNRSKFTKSQHFQSQNNKNISKQSPTQLDQQNNNFSHKFIKTKTQSFHNQNLHEQSKQLGKQQKSSLHVKNDNLSSIFTAPKRILQQYKGQLYKKTEVMKIKKEYDENYEPKCLTTNKQKEDQFDKKEFKFGKKQLLQKKKENLPTPQLQVINYTQTPNNATLKKIQYDERDFIGFLMDLETVEIIDKYPELRESCQEDLEFQQLTHNQSMSIQTVNQNNKIYDIYLGNEIDQLQEQDEYKDSNEWNSFSD
ncbi:hypothetical protein PPERSA_12961 [Pseudocohnilembus persalinus]|uniref:Uncharacterized protein n=1 Tax=Pseudocohnilembus persalinus TaxID=266149 RepID=A0A0V0R2I4_PSEPJ|nr:hypothetical protein PPERSA_12961 [Pseudocohnilembus persalinus]|eukprot:KRX08480.1 hypothetical protein PPERSA_12961 [Pseudocohnilembus persalinus]